VENLEGRLVPSTVYVESNNPDLAENAVLAFRRDPSDGSLTQIGTYATNGTGQFNLPKVLGPDDSDQEVVATPDGRFLFAVNQGSNSITSFRIGYDGGLDYLGTVDSGGVQPVSLGIAGDRLYVANRGDETANHDGTVAPNYTGFTINNEGWLSAIPGSTVTFPVGTSPAQALISRTGRFLFADIFGIPNTSAPQDNTIAPFLIKPDGTLQLAPGGNVGAPVDPPLLLGTASHPTLNIVYAGLTGANEVGVFTYNETGRLDFVTDVPDQGAAGCWCVVSGDGRFLYVATTGTDSIGVFSLADPLNPVQIQEFALPHADGDQGQTADFQIGLDPTGQSLYVVNQSTNATGTNHRGNQLHTLSVAADGTVSEPQDPIVFAPGDVPANAHPQGVAVVNTPDRYRFRSDGRGRSGLGTAVLAPEQVQLIGGANQLAAVAPSTAIDPALDENSTGQVPVAVRGTADTTDTIAARGAPGRGASRAGHGDGQSSASSELDGAGLDALFASDVRRGGAS
jgi:6-phosphogluconolactonase (cycloisomerase 2 family)